MESFYYKFSELNNIKLNSNILETGFTNILILIWILIYFKENILEDKLKKRKITITKNIKKIENQLIEAARCFEDRKKQLNKLSILSNRIKSETNLLKKKLLKSNIDQFKNDLDILFDIYLSKLYSKRQKIHSEMYQKIILLVFKKLKVQYCRKYRKEDYTSNLINKIINKFENDHIK